MVMFPTYCDATIGAPSTGFSAPVSCSFCHCEMPRLSRIIAGRIGPKNGSSLARIGRYFGFIEAEPVKSQRDWHQISTFDATIAAERHDCASTTRSRPEAHAHPEVAIERGLKCAPHWLFSAPALRRKSETNVFSARVRSRRPTMAISWPRQGRSIVRVELFSHAAFFVAAMCRRHSQILFRDEGS